MPPRPSSASSENRPTVVPLRSGRSVLRCFSGLSPSAVAGRRRDVKFTKSAFGQPTCEFGHPLSEGTATWFEILGESATQSKPVALINVGAARAARYLRRRRQPLRVAISRAMHSSRASRPALALVVAVRVSSPVLSTYHVLVPRRLGRKQSHLPAPALTSRPVVCCVVP